MVFTNFPIGMKVTPVVDPLLDMAYRKSILSLRTCYTSHPMCVFSVYHIGSLQVLAQIGSLQPGMRALSWHFSLTWSRSLDSRILIIAPPHIYEPIFLLIFAISKVRPILAIIPWYPLLIFGLLAE